MILIKTYAADAPWLTWLLRSAVRFASGFGPWHILTEPESRAAVYDAARAAAPPDFHIVDVYATLPDSRRIASGYIRQQYCKLHGDLVTGGDHVQLDSDCFFIRDTTPALWGTPPYWLMTPYSALSGDVLRHQELTSRLLGFDVHHEYMRRAGFYMRAEGLAGLREHLERQHGKSVAALFAELGSASEYNLYGAWCHRFAPHLYRWIDTAATPPDQWPPTHVWQGWSYEGVTPAREQWFRDVLDGTVVP